MNNIIMKLLSSLIEVDGGLQEFALICDFDEFTCLVADDIKKMKGEIAFCNTLRFVFLSARVYTQEGKSFRVKIAKLLKPQIKAARRA